MLSVRKKSVVISLFIILFIIITMWVMQIKEGRLPFIDQVVSQYFSTLSHSSYLYKVARIITELGSRQFLIPLTIICGIILIIIYRHIIQAITFAGGTYVTHLLNEWIKYFIARERPSILSEANAIGYSFPSGHSMIPVVCYGLFLFFLVRKYNKYQVTFRVILITLVLAIAVSRIVINVHYVTDVITGLTLGTLMLYAWTKFYQVWYKV